MHSDVLTFFLPALTILPYYVWALQNCIRLVDSTGYCLNRPIDSIHSHSSWIHFACILLRKLKNAWTIINNNSIALNDFVFTSFSLSSQHSCSASRKKTIYLLLLLHESDLHSNCFFFRWFFAPSLVQFYIQREKRLVMDEGKVNINHYFYL